MRKRSVFVLAACVLAGLVTASWVGAEIVNSFRCGSSLIMAGDSAGKVKASCGEPTGLKRARKGATMQGTLGGEFVDEEWIYNMGPTDFIYTLRFAGGQLRAISREGRGY